MRGLNGLVQAHWRGRKGFFSYEIGRVHWRPVPVKGNKQRKNDERGLLGYEELRLFNIKGFARQPGDPLSSVLSLYLARAHVSPRPLGQGGTAWLFFPRKPTSFFTCEVRNDGEKVENIGGDRSSTTSSSTTSKSERLQCDREKKRRHTPLRIRSECRCFSVFQRDDYSYTIDHALDEKPHSTAMRLRVFFRRPWDAIRRGTKPEGTTEETQWISELDRLEKKWYFNSNANG